MRQRIPLSGFNSRPHMFRHPITLIGIASMTPMVSDLTSLTYLLTLSNFDFLRSQFDFPGRLKLQMVLLPVWDCLGGNQAVFLCVLAKSNGLTD